MPSAGAAVTPDSFFEVPLWMDRNGVQRRPAGTKGGFLWSRCPPLDDLAHRRSRASHTPRQCHSADPLTHPVLSCPLSVEDLLLRDVSMLFYKPESQKFPIRLWPTRLGMPKKQCQRRWHRLIPPECKLCWFLGGTLAKNFSCCYSNVVFFVSI